MTDRDTLHAVSLALVRSLFPLRNPIRLIGVTLSGFEEAPAGETLLDLI